MRDDFFPQPHKKIEDLTSFLASKEIEDPHLKPRKKSEVRSDLRTSPHLSQMSGSHDSCNFLGVPVNLLVEIGK